MRYPSRPRQPTIWFLFFFKIENLLYISCAAVPPTPGKNSKSLVASASVNKVEKLNDVVGDPDNKFKMLSYYLHLENILIFKKPIGIKELVNNLEFIKNKKNYGLDMLTGVVKISQNDFNYIIKNDYK